MLQISLAIKVLGLNKRFTWGDHGKNDSVDEIPLGLELNRISISAGIYSSLTIYETF